MADVNDLTKMFIENSISVDSYDFYELEVEKIITPSVALKIVTTYYPQKEFINVGENYEILRIVDDNYNSIHISYKPTDFSKFVLSQGLSDYIFGQLLISNNYVYFLSSPGVFRYVTMKNIIKSHF